MITHMHPRLGEIIGKIAFLLPAGAGAATSAATDLLSSLALFRVTENIVIEL